MFPAAGSPDVAGGGGVSVIYMHPAGSRKRRQFATSVAPTDARQMRGLYMSYRRRLRTVAGLEQHERRRFARHAALSVIAVHWCDVTDGGETLRVEQGEYHGDDCHGCAQRVRDFDPNGCELPDGARWHWRCMTEPVVALVNSSEYGRATDDYDHYRAAGGAASFSVWASRYGSDYQ